VSEIIEAILRREGGYVSHPADKGGPTNFGITQATLAHYRGQAVNVADVQNLTREEAVTIYESLYEKPFARFSATPKLMALIVDSAVQHGVGRVQDWLKAIPSTDPDVNYRGLLQRRVVFYGEIITSNPSQAVFAKGWLNRVAEFVR
jgi:lysozyme family protein